MRIYRIFYRFDKTHTSLVMRSETGYGALRAAEGMLQPGARAYGVEMVR